ncbi:MAG: SNF2 helicase associated domain-containing protein [Clostridia bacterium]|nr:SNF2 helicase associated domain-containing protein [Clostridia bacterium]
MIIDITDLELESLNIARNFDKERKNRGKRIYRNRDLEIKEVQKIDGKEEYNIKALVDGNYGVYKVNLNIKDNVLEDCSCTCEDYKKGNVCKHIFATAFEAVNPHEPNTQEGIDKMEEQRRKEMEEQRKLLEIKRQEAERKRKYQERYHQALGVISKYKNDGTAHFFFNESPKDINLEEMYQKALFKLSQEENTNTNFATSIQIEPRLEIDWRDSKAELTFKIGEKMKYVIKNIEEFIEAFEKEEILQFGKKLRFVAKKENFCEEDQKLLQFIIDYMQIIKYNKKIYGSQHYYYSPTLSDKTITLFEDSFDNFIETLGKKPVEISTYNNGVNQYEIAENNLNIKLNIIPKEDEYVFKINIKNYEFIETNKYFYVFYNKKIYKIDKNQNEELSIILGLFRYDSEVLIPKDKYAEFSTYVMPKFSKYIENNNLPAENVKEGLIVNNLASKIYLDLDDRGNIMLELKFCYLDKEFNLLDPNAVDYINQNDIIRNIPEERKVVQRIFMDGFELANNKTYFLLQNEDYIYDFLANKINGYMQDFEVLATERLKNRQIRRAQIPNVSVKLENGLLELDISKIDIDINEIKNVLKNYSIKKKYYKLKNGDFLSLEQNENLDFLNNMANVLDVNFDKLENGVIKLPTNRSVYLEKLLEKNKNITTNKNDNYTKLINNIENKNFSDNIKIPKDFEKPLRDYQKTGYKWLKVIGEYGFGGILADDMGLGKTLQIIALLSDELKNKKKKPSIVVCPSSLVLNWKAEVEKWCNDLKVLIIKGDAQTRKKLIASYDKYNLIITSYDLLKRDILEYEEKSFKYIIADEAQYIKNSITQNATSLKSLEGEIKFALTGTPIENSVAELWSIFDFVMPGYLYSYSKFKKRFEEPILKEQNKEAMQKLKEIINPFILRRIKKDVLTELPDKSITIMKNEMEDEQSKIYLSYLAQTKKEVAQELNDNGFEKSKFKILMLLTRLRQICCHPGLFIDNYTGESGKLKQCLDIMQDAIEAGHKILLFSSYTSMFEILEEKLNKNKIKYFKLTGSTQVDKRVEMVEQFNNDKETKVFLISLKAGGTGLNLTGADVVIHYDPWWNISIENQATDRAYRIGQKNSVQVYKLITTNSIEEKINKLQEKKSELSEQLLSTTETFVNKLSKEEIMNLFEMD